MYQYRIHCTTISKFVPEVCQAIYDALKEKYFSVPRTQQEWNEIIENTYRRWNFPNCFAAVDGKHIPLLCPKNSGSDYFCYKSFFSVVLLAFVDYDYCFQMVDIGCQGRISDGGVMKNSPMYPAIKQNLLDFPPPRCLPYPSNYPLVKPLDKIPMVFAADDAFQLDTFCMKPFGQRNLSIEKRIFNYRLSRFRRVTENAFGIWSSRFRLFSTRCNVNVEKIEIITLASLVLHNMLRKRSPSTYTPPGYCDTIDHVTGEILDGEWRSENTQSVLVDLEPTKSKHASLKAEQVRKEFTDFFMTGGQVDWQWKHAI